MTAIITKLEIQNFKTFNHVEFNLKNLIYDTTNHAKCCPKGPVSAYF
jgi:hypothetical protein